MKASEVDRVGSRPIHTLAVDDPHRVEEYLRQHQGDDDCWRSTSLEQSSEGMRHSADVMDDRRR